MINAIVLFSIFLLCLIFYQDYKYRAYYWIIALFLAISFVVYNLLTVSLDIFLYNLIVNFFILFVQFSLMVAILSLKERKLIINFTKEYMGIGDVILFLNLCLLFSTLNFIFFMLASLFLICLGIMAFRILKISFNNQLPFGGLQSLCLILVLVCTFVFGDFKVNNDGWILALIWL